MSTMMPAMSANMRLPAVHLRRAKDDPRIAHALVAEFLGVAFFQLLSATVAQGPLQTALSFAAIMYVVQWISGGHLNPAVSLAALGSGHIDALRGLLYIVAQILGAVVGAFLQVLVTPGEHFGKHSPTACFRPVGVNGPELFGWEFLLTTFFIMVMYAGIFAAPGHGSIAPLASGLALFGVTATGGMFTGFSPVNPARVLAAMLIFHCNLGWGWTYLAAQLAGAGAAIVWAWFMYGKGTWFGGVNPDAFTGAHGTLGERLLPGGAAAHDPASAGSYGTGAI